MDPDPVEFPILSYVISHLPHLGPINKPMERVPEDKSSSIEIKMPLLADPMMSQSMGEAISDVLQTRSVLQTLGERPSKEAVEKARDRIAEIESRLSRKLGEMVTAPRPSDVDRLRWRGMMAERECEIRRAAEEEKRGFKAVVQVDEMFGEYDKMVGEAEERLRRIYEGVDGDEVLREEVVGILREASRNVLERVELRGRSLRYLPEAFGRMVFVKVPIPIVLSVMDAIVVRPPAKPPNDSVYSTKFNRDYQSVFE